MGRLYDWAAARIRILCDGVTGTARKLERTQQELQNEREQRMGLEEALGMSQELMFSDRLSREDAEKQRAVAVLDKKRSDANYRKATKAVRKSRHLVRAARDIYWKAMRAVDVKKARATAMAESDDSLRVAEEQVAAAKAELLSIEGLQYSIAVGSIVEDNPKLALVYYDRPNQQVHLTPRAKEFLGVEKAPLIVSRKALLDYVVEDDRAKILDALTQGNDLNHFKTHTSTKIPKDLALTTHTYRMRGEPVGIAIALYHPKFSFRNLGVGDFFKRVDSVLARVGKTLENIKVANPDSQAKPYLT